MEGIGFDQFGRPDWHTYFMSLSLLIAQRSIDPSTKHGSVIVDDDRTILAVGYNGPPRGCIDKNIPLTRPEKYAYMVHSEVAAIANAARSGVRIRGSMLYVTGQPSEKYLGLLINAGIKRIYFGSISSKCVSADSMQISEKILENQDILMIPCHIPFENLQRVLEGTVEYVRQKTDS